MSTWTKFAKCPARLKYQDVSFQKLGNYV